MSGMAHFCARVGSGVSRDLASIIRATFWFHICNDRPRGNGLFFWILL